MRTITYTGVFSGQQVQYRLSEELYEIRPGYSRFPVHYRILRPGYRVRRIALNPVGDQRGDGLDFGNSPGWVTVCRAERTAAEWLDIPPEYLRRVE